MRPDAQSEWFLVTPNNKIGHDAASEQLPRASKSVVDALGHPWLIGNWSLENYKVGGTGDRQLITIGPCSITSDELHHKINNLENISDITKLARTLDGSVYLIARIGRQIRVQGTISGVRRVFRTSLHGTTVASNRPDLLADINNVDVCRERLAARLIFTVAPSPLDQYTMWREIETIPPGSYLEISNSNTARVNQWWSPPEPCESLEKRAPDVLSRLSQAVQLRSPKDRTIGSDLSGGLDSTPLSFLAAKYGSAKVITVTASSVDAAHDDRVWAASAAAQLEETRQILISKDELPKMFSGVHQVEYNLPEPYTWWRARDRILYFAKKLESLGATAHIVGHGGDEVLQAPISYLHNLIRQQPLTAIRHINGYRAMIRWPINDVFQALRDRRNYGEWLSSNAQNLTSRLPRRKTPFFGWSMPLHLPPWATAEAVQLARKTLLDAADYASPLAQERYQHGNLQMIRRIGASIDATNILTRSTKVDMEAPFLDDRVIESCLSIRPEEKNNPHNYKPLITAAMRTVMPDHSLSRSTKGEFSGDFHVGLAKHRRDIDALFNKSLLAANDLIDIRKLKKYLDLYPTDLPSTALDATLACESWLQSFS